MNYSTRLLITAGIMSAGAFSICGQSILPVETGKTGTELPAPDLSGFIPADTIDLSQFSDSAAPDLSGFTPTGLPARIFFPRVFSGYRAINRPRKYTVFPDPEVFSDVAQQNAFLEIADSISDRTEYELEIPDWNIPARDELPVAFGSVIPAWLRQSLNSRRFEDDLMYNMMVEHPVLIQYTYWDLPVPPTLPEEDFSFTGYVKRLNLPEITVAENLPVFANAGRINWLHNFNISLQLSQAYVSGNWYQGGTSHYAFFGNFLWDVMLNPVFYPKLMFQSTVAYKLSLNSTPDDLYHKYNVSQDLFQYNLKAGYKAVYNWYYSFLLQYKTQFLNSYPANSLERKASFLSPGELNLGLGMTYTKTNAAKTISFSASISPISYNFKTCIDKYIDPTQFGIKPGHKCVNEIGSNAEVNFKALIWGNTTYTTRLFIFSDYKAFQTDWENTLNFQFSRLFSTQIYAHLRYDTSADSSIDRKWGKFMLKEILSVGISYTFSTK